MALLPVLKTLVCRSRGSNPRPPAHEADALTTCHRGGQHIVVQLQINLARHGQHIVVQHEINLARHSQHIVVQHEINLARHGQHIVVQQEINLARHIM